VGLIARRYAEGRKASGSSLGWPNEGWPPIPGFATSTTTAAGITVSQDTAYTIAAYFQGVRKISKDVASRPLILYRRGRDAQGRPTRSRAEEHALYDVLKTRPNPEMTSLVFRETLQAHLLTWGNAYAERELNGLGQTVRLWPLRPDRMKVTIDRESGERVYEYRIRPGTPYVRLPRSRVFHIPGFGFDGLIGYSILNVARETLADAVALREYGSRVLLNDARPGVILKHPGQLSDPALKRLRKGWEGRHGGFSNAGRTAILEEGMDVSVLGLPRNDVLFLDGRRFSVREVARWLDLPPHKLADMDDATFSNIEEQSIEYEGETLLGHFERWEQQIEADLLPEPDLFVEHLIDAKLRSKTLERYQAYDLAMQNKAMVPNEWRASEGWDPVPWGDDPIETPNNTPPDVRVQPQEPKASPDPGLSAAITALVAKESPAPTVNVTVPEREVHVGEVHVGDKVSVESPELKVEAPVSVSIDDLEGAVREGYDALVDRVSKSNHELRELLTAPESRHIERDERGKALAVVVTKAGKVTRLPVKRDEKGNATDIG
jgi:HK97 family phage portal protein